MLNFRDLPPGFMTHVTCRLTANNRDQLRNPTLGNRVRATCSFCTFAKSDAAVRAGWFGGLLSYAGARVPGGAQLAEEQP